MKILIILKERFYNNNPVKSYGLINSSSFIAEYLNAVGCKVKVVTVVDANGIDKEVNEYKPNMVIIEALWVPGPKMKELIEIKRYKHIRWVVRIHSDAGFLSAETFAMKLINDYIAINKSNLTIAPNNKEFTEYLSNALCYNFKYLPNIVEVKHRGIDCECGCSKIMDVGCFGSLRVLKNQLFQALVAIKAADLLNKKLRFHITTDVNIKKEAPGYPGGSNPVLKNLQELFKNSPHELVEHPWEENDDFQKLIKKMDVGMQLSYTESFNIVAADFVNNNRVIIVSEAINWMPDILKASTVNYDEATEKLIYAYRNRHSAKLIKKMRESLIKYNAKAKVIWYNFIF
jgi:hypothetical protein